MTTPRVVLIVDDDHGFRRVMEFQLGEDGHRVLTADGTAAALQQLKSSAVDVIISDVKMPGDDGMQLLARVKALQPELPIIMLTARAEESDRIVLAHGGRLEVVKTSAAGTRIRVLLPAAGPAPAPSHAPAEAL